MRFEAISATPSTSPSDAAPVFSTDMKNAGNTDATISEEKSLKKLVSPRKKTLRGSPRILSFTSNTLSSRVDVTAQCPAPQPPNNN
jgi:beta-lactamase regulating signal transducer with metallopeptidase domain